MPPEQYSVIIERIDGLKELMLEKFQQNEDEHKQIIDHQKWQNGQLNKNTEFRIRQGTHNKWIYAIITLVALPTIFLFLRSIL